MILALVVAALLQLPSPPPPAPPADAGPPPATVAEKPPLYEGLTPQRLQRIQVKTHVLIVSGARVERPGLRQVIQTIRGVGYVVRDGS